MRGVIALLVLAVAALAILGLPAGCGDGPETSDLYLLEELETAAAVEDPNARIERLDIFVRNHPEHPYRAVAWERMLDAMASGEDGRQRALTRFDEIIERESDPGIRGQMLYAKFRFVWEADSLQAISLAREMVTSGESDYRLLMYVSYYLMEARGHEEAADAVFSRLMEVAGDSLRLSHARTVYAEYLDATGRREEAFRELTLASSYPFANEKLGRRLWDDGDRGAAMDAYIRLVAGVPGSLEHLNLDSLYALASPGAGDLGERIAAARIISGHELPDRSFVDTDGRRHSLSGYRGTKLVIVAFSPT